MEIYFTPTIEANLLRRGRAMTYDPRSPTLLSVMRVDAKDQAVWERPHDLIDHPERGKQRQPSHFHS